MVGALLGGGATSTRNFADSRLKVPLVKGFPAASVTLTTSNVVVPAPRATMSTVRSWVTPVTVEVHAVNWIAPVAGDVIVATSGLVDRNANVAGVARETLHPLKPSMSALRACRRKPTVEVLLIVRPMTSAWASSVAATAVVPSWVFQRS